MWRTPRSEAQDAPPLSHTPSPSPEQLVDVALQSRSSSPETLEQAMVNMSASPRLQGAPLSGRRIPSVEEMMGIFYVEHPKGIRMRSPWNPSIGDVRLFCKLVRHEIVEARYGMKRPRKGAIIESASVAAFGENLYVRDSNLKPGIP